MKKLFAVILSAAMAITAVPMQAFAAMTTLPGLENGMIAVDGVITLTDDVELKAPVKVSADVTLDLNGHKITASSAFTPITYGDINKSNYLFVVHRGAHLTIKDSVGGGIIDAATNANDTNKLYTAIQLTEYEELGDETAALTVESGAIKGYYYCIAGNANRSNTVITINGGTIEGSLNDDSSGIFHPQNGTLTINDGTIKGGAGVEIRNGELNVKGGTIASKATSWGSVKKSGNGNTTAGAGLAVVPHSGKDVKATLTGGTIHGVVVTANDNLKAMKNDGSATLVIKGNAVIKDTVPNDINQTYGLRLWRGATATISGNAKIDVDGYGIDVIGWKTGAPVTTLNVNGGTITAKDGFAICGNGSTDLGNTVMNITDGVITSENTVAVYHPQDGKLNITGGTITGATGVYVKSGSVTIDGNAKVVGTKVENGGASSGNGANGTGEAVVVEKDSSYGENLAVEIKDGTFVSLQGKAPVQSKGTGGNDPIKNFVKGGHFSDDLKQYDGGNVLDTELTVTLKANSGIAPYSYYKTVADAQNAIERKVGGTITDADGNTTVVAPVKAKKYDVTVNDDIENGTVTVDAARAKAGSTVTITVTPDKGYELKELTVLDSYKDEVDVEKGKKDGKFTFDMPKDDVTVDATFKKVKDTSKDEPTEQPEEQPTETPAGDEGQTKIVLTLNQRVSEVNGEFKVNDVAPILRNDRTMLPIRMIAEALGATVTWNDAEQKVTITKDDMEIVIYIGQAFATVNNTPVALDAPAFIENGRTYLPLRFVAENLGATVTWDAQTQQVTIIG